MEAQMLDVGLRDAISSVEIRKVLTLSMSWRELQGWSGTGLDMWPDKMDC